MSREIPVYRLLGYLTVLVRVFLFPHIKGFPESDPAGFLAATLQGQPPQEPL